eukprot:scaffold222325_cov29-Prasinocladus_malaysianus.AAC.3
MTGSLTGAGACRTAVEQGSETLHRRSVPSSPAERMRLGSNGLKSALHTLRPPCSAKEVMTSPLEASHRCRQPPWSALTRYDRMYWFQSMLDSFSLASSSITG